VVVVAVIAMVSALACVSHHIARDVETAPVSGRGTELGIETPHLDGPDEIDLAPLVALSGAGYAFDHEPIVRTTLEPRFQSYRANFAVLHPYEPAPREVLLACSPSVSSDEISSVLDTARRSGFDHARLVFESERSRSSSYVVDSRHTLSAAWVSLTDQVGSQPPNIRPAEVQNCAELSERVIALRRAGQMVTLTTRAPH